MSFFKKLFSMFYNVFIVIRERLFLIPPTELPPPQPSPFMREGMGGKEPPQTIDVGVNVRSPLPAEKRTKNAEILPLLENQHVSLCEALDRILNTGVVVNSNITISVANIDLIYIDLRALLTSVETARKI